MLSGEIALKNNHYYSTVEMSEAEIRRNARRQKILQNSEQRLQKLAKGTLFTFVCFTYNVNCCCRKPLLLEKVLSTN